MIKARERLEDVRRLIETKRSLQRGLRDMDKDVLNTALTSVSEIQLANLISVLKKQKRQEKLKEINEEETS